MSSHPILAPMREHLVHALYEAAELEHNLMCTYLYAAFSLKDGIGEGLAEEEAAATKRWRRTILDVAIEEMGHLTAVWNITAALGATPRFGRSNFPIDPGRLPAGLVVKLAPFSKDVLQHFIYLERPESSDELDGSGFEPTSFARGAAVHTVTPMAVEYHTVGQLYKAIEDALAETAARIGEEQLFCGDPGLQLAPSHAGLKGADVVRCSKTAIAALAAIVNEGEGASAPGANSHYNRFRAIRDEYVALLERNPACAPAHPAAVNPVLRRPPGLGGRVWIEDADTSAIVDVANATYQTMLRLLAYAYAVRDADAEKRFAVDLGLDLMKAITFLAESAARRPAGPSAPGCNGGMSFTALRDAAPLPQGAGARRFFAERLRELSSHADALDQADMRVARAAGFLRALAVRAERFPRFTDAPAASRPAERGPPPQAASSTSVDGVDIAEGAALSVAYDGERCIHARFCVTKAPRTFLANVEGPWIHPDETHSEELRAVIRQCPSGALHYVRKDGGQEELAPPVNLIAVRENGPYALYADVRVDEEAIGYRATLCRCGASKNKPYCDNSHHESAFAATGEPPTCGRTAMLEARDGPLDVTPTIDGPLVIRGNMEITSGTGRVVARVPSARLCRCGHSNTKPFCDNSHARIGFRSQ